MKKRFYGIIGSLLIIAGVVSVLMLGSIREENPRGTTTANLKVVLQALRDYQEQQGRLPQKLAELDINDEVQLDGNGRPFEFVHRKVAADRQGYVHYVTAAMTKPAKDGMFSDPWWYAIVQNNPYRNEIEIKSGPGEEGRKRLAAEYE